MSEWGKYSLGAVIQLIGGGTPKTSVPEYWNGDIPWLSVVDFNHGRKYVSKTEKNITQKGLENSSTKYLRKGDLIISARGTVGALAVLNKDMTFNQSCYGVKGISNVTLTEYVYYLLKNTVRELSQISHGGVFDTITRATFDDIEINLPPLPEQKAIADVLSALDDKIDLLHRQNHTLEQMAETLFRQWFVEEAQEDWEEVELGQFITCINGVSYKSSELIHSKNALVTLKNFARNGGLRKDGFKEYSGQFKDAQIVKDGDIVVAHTDLTQDASLIGKPIYVYNLNHYDNLVISMDLVKVVLKSNTLNQTFLYYLLKSPDFKEFALANSNGSSVIHLSKKALPNFTFKLPPKNKIKYFNELANPLDKKLELNLKQIQTLEILRDTLLPKLISGEVRVNVQAA